MRVPCAVCPDCVLPRQDDPRWPHMIFSMPTLLNVAARLYDSPEYPVACYSVHERTGQKKRNPYLDEAHWKTFLNHITIRQFNRLCRLVHQERIGFGGRTFRAGRLLRLLAQGPFIDDFFCAALYTVLQKPLQSCAAAAPPGR
jgi:hypothetical protein